MLFLFFTNELSEYSDFGPAHGNFQKIANIKKGLTNNR